MFPNILCISLSNGNSCMLCLTSITLVAIRCGRFVAKKLPGDSFSLFSHPFVAISIYCYIFDRYSIVSTKCRFLRNGKSRSNHRLWITYLMTVTVPECRSSTNVTTLCINCIVAHDMRRQFSLLTTLAYANWIRAVKLSSIMTASTSEKILRITNSSTPRKSFTYYRSVSLLDCCQCIPKTYCFTADVAYIISTRIQYEG